MKDFESANLCDIIDFIKETHSVVCCWSSATLWSRAIDKTCWTSVLVDCPTVIWTCRSLAGTLIVLLSGCMWLDLARTSATVRDGDARGNSCYRPPHTNLKRYWRSWRGKLINWTLYSLVVVFLLFTAVSLYAGG